MVGAFGFALGCVLSPKNEPIMGGALVKLGGRAANGPVVPGAITTLAEKRTPLIAAHTWDVGRGRLHFVDLLVVLVASVDQHLTNCAGICMTSTNQTNMARIKEFSNTMNNGSDPCSSILSPSRYHRLTVRY